MSKHHMKSKLINWFLQLPRPKKTLFSVLAITLTVAIIAVSTLAVFGQFGNAVDIISGKYLPEKTDDPYISVNAGNTGKVPADIEIDPVGATLLAGYLKNGADYHLDADGWKSEIDNALSYASKNGLNTVIVPLNENGNKIYGGESDALAYITKAASKKSIAVYGEYSLLAKGNKARYLISSDEDISAISNEIDSIVSSYSLSGLLLNDYYTVNGGADYAAYINGGSGMGLDAYLRDRLAKAVEKIAGSAKEANGGITVGITADAVWATEKKVKGGIESDAELFEALTDGHADTVMWLNKGYADCVFVSIPYSTRDTSVPFGEVAEWWTKMVGATTRLNFTLAAYNVGSGETWDSPTQLADQLSSVPVLTASGYAFDSISSLEKDTTGNAKNATRYLSEHEAMGVKGLSFTSVYSNKFTTYSKVLSFTGASDPDYALKMNGKEVKRTARGYFSFNETLKNGENTFVFEHKGKTRTFNITYEAVIIKRVAPRADQKLGGGSIISVSVTARNGSAVTATLGGTTITLNRIGSENNDTAIKQEFFDYTGVFTLPEAVNSAQDLGAIEFKAVCRSLSDSATGGRITVRAKGDTSVSSGGSYQSGYGIQVDVGTRYVAEVISPQAQTLDGDLIDERSRPTNAYLPAGTVDYCDENEIIYYSPYNDENTSFRKLDYGKRVYSDAVSVFKATLPETNSITLKSTEIKDRHTVMTFDTQWKAPFNVTLAPQDYANPYAPNAMPDYSVSDVTYEYIDIEFCYAVSAQGKISLNGNPVFKNGEWIKNGNNFVLRLYLKKAGSFYGWTAQYNEKNQLEFYFLNPAKITTAPNNYGYRLDGVVIMLDPGHGGEEDPGAVGSNTVNTEAVLNLYLTKKIQRELENLGATVVLTRSTNETVYLVERSAMANEVKPDLFISIHRNASTSTSAEGYSNYYFHPFSKPFAQAIYDRTVKAFYYERRVNYYPFHVARISCCPSILTENGFMSNALDFARIQTDSHNEINAYYTVQGIIDYFAAIQ